MCCGLITDPAVSPGFQKVEMGNLVLPFAWDMMWATRRAKALIGDVGCPSQSREMHCPRLPFFWFVILKVAWLSCLFENVDVWAVWKNDACCIPEDNVTDSEALCASTVLTW